MRILALAIVLMTLGSVPVIASGPDWAIPVQCSIDANKTVHPLWYRPGGFCTSHYGDFGGKPAHRPLV